MTEAAPLSVWVKSRILFSAPTLWFGLALTIVGSFSLNHLCNALDVKSALVFSEDDPQVSGRLIAKGALSFDAEEEWRREVVYRYEVDSKGYEFRSVVADKHAVLGRAVTVQYLARDPATARLAGRTFGASEVSLLMLVLVFPLGGLGMLVAALRYYKKYRDLIQHGVVTVGTISKKGKARHDFDVGNICDVAFLFKTADGLAHEGPVSTHLAVKNVGGAEALAYMAARPGDAELFVTMPKTIRRLLETRND